VEDRCDDSLFRFVGRRYLNLNGVNVVGLRRIHGDDSETVIAAIRVPGLHGSRGLRTGSAGPHQIDGHRGDSQTGGRVTGIHLLHLLFGILLAGLAGALRGGRAADKVEAAVWNCSRNIDGISVDCVVYFSGSALGLQAHGTGDEA
jgi:hypothetical protein